MGTYGEDLLNLCYQQICDGQKHTTSIFVGSLRQTSLRVYIAPQIYWEAVCFSHVSQCFGFLF